MSKRKLATSTLLACALAGAALGGPSNATPKEVFAADFEYGFQGEGTAVIQDADRRVGKVLPTAEQERLVREMGATRAVWSPFGSPKVLINHGGYLSEPRAGKAVDVARAWVRDNAALFRLTPERTTPEHLELIGHNPFYDSTDLRRQLQGQKPLNKDVASAVLFRQVYGGVNAAQDGLLNLGVAKDGRIAFVASTTTGDTEVDGRWALDGIAAWRAAAADVGRKIPAADLTLVTARDHAGFTVFRLKGTPDLQRVRKVVLPTPTQGIRPAWEVNVDDATAPKTFPQAYISLVDAETGKVWVRTNAVDHLDGGGAMVRPQVGPGPQWSGFDHSPDLPVQGQASPDNRKLYCWTEAAGCERVLGPTSPSRFPFDELPDETGTAAAPTFTTRGNNADTTSSYISHQTPDSPYSPVSPTRAYTFPFTDQWHTSNCQFTRNQVTVERNDIDASITNLFLMHNRVHDWTYLLGWTESAWNMQYVNFGEDTETSATARDGDPEKGQAQAGGLAGSVVFTGRDNANQRTMQDGVPGITNQYLWHPLQAGFYAACTDGAYDMPIIVHEVVHATSNRMTGGPDANIGGSEGGSMGESWSDLAAVEYVNSHNFPPPAGAHPFSMAPYATGAPITGIRNYNMSMSPLTYGNLAYDGNGTTSPHADGEIWSATQYDVRQALLDKYDAKFPYSNAELRRACTNGEVPADKCPGNRRWIQQMFDGFLLQPAAPTMLDARDAQFASNVMRFGGKDQTEMWNAFAKRGMGQTADAPGTPAFNSPRRTDEAKVTFQAVPVAGGGVPAETKVYVGRYEARAAASAMSPAGKPSGAVEFVPGTYEFIASGAGYGHHRFTRTFKPGEKVTVSVPMRKNFASITHGAEASGDGGNLDAIIDDTEATNWAYLGATTDTVEGKQVTVDLSGTRQLVAEVQVSAANRPQETGNADDPLANSRFAALRSFEILTCDTTTGKACEGEEDFKVIYTSPADAFPTGRPRPLAPNLQIRTFDVPDTMATHVRLRVLTNQCTGNPIYSGAENPVGEPLSDPDCVSGFTGATLVTTDPNTPPTINNSQAFRVRAAELQVFSNATPGSALPAPGTPARPAPKPNPGVGGDPKPAPKPDPLPATGLATSMLPALLMAGTAAVMVRRRREV
ncbi:MAG TPA: M36 family metallopeptidase [Mycobacteriales bacterium]|nr:M36 family metallopeptidase [Mycobacteriales bacterium]